MKKEKELKKKKWARPKLIILTRGKPEEGALLACKTEAAAAGSVKVAAGCLVNIGIPPWCGMCDAWAST
jgi:hypothetical protein